MNGGLRPYDIRTEPCTALDAPGQERPELFCCLHGMAGAGSCPRVPAPGVPAASDFHRVSVCFCLPPFDGRAEGASMGPGTPPVTRDGYSCRTASPTPQGPG